MMIQNKKLLTLPEQIADHIKEAILLGQLKPGQKLPTELELAKHYLVSRPTIRDAIKILADSKLVTTKSGAKGGHFIADFAPNSFVDDFSSYLTLSMSLKEIKLQEVTAMRKIVEVESCVLAAAERREEDLETMESILQTLTNSLPDHIYYQKDVEFHRSIAKATQNRFIQILLDAFNIAVSPFFHSIHWPEALKTEMNLELGKIYEAIKKHDAKLAAELMNSHLQRSEQHFSLVRPDLMKL